MAYGLYTASYGPYNAGHQVSITDVATGLPATILASELGGLVTTNGLTKLDSNGDLSVYIDLSRTWSVDVFEEVFRDNSSVNLVRKITSPEIPGFRGDLGVTYVVEETSTHYYWDGDSLVAFPNKYQTSSIDSLTNQTFSSFTYNVGGKLTGYIRNGVPHTVSYPTSDQVIISNITGTSRTINLDLSGRVTSIL